MSDDDSYSYESYDSLNSTDACAPALPKRTRHAGGGGSGPAATEEEGARVTLFLDHVVGDGGGGGGGGGGGERSEYSAGAFRCATSGALAAVMQRQVAQVSEQSGLPVAEALQFLHATGWNSERLLEYFFDNESVLRARLGVLRDPGVPPARPPEWGVPGATAWCGVLFEDVPAESMDAAPCGHWFSAVALREHLTTLLAASPIDAPLARCVAAGCGALLPARLVEAHLPPELLARWREWGVRRFARDSRNIMMCPGTDCAFAVVHRSRRPCVDVVCASGRASA